MTISTYGAVVVSARADEGTTVHEQWSVLWPEVSPVGEVTGWTREPCADGAEAWARVADAASTGVVMRVDMRRVTVCVDAWFPPVPPKNDMEASQ